jgi:hypothetical protein
MDLTDDHMAAIREDSVNVLADVVPVLPKSGAASWKSVMPWWCIGRSRGDTTEPDRRGSGPGTAEVNCRFLAAHWGVAPTGAQRGWMAADLMRASPGGGLPEGAEDAREK